MTFRTPSKTRTGRGGNCCRGYFAIPDVVNMLDNERTRWINATLFFAIGWQVTLMVVSPSTVDVPYERFKMSNFPFILRKLLTIAYYLVVFSPVVMGLPRQGSPDAENELSSEGLFEP